MAYNNELDKSPIIEDILSHEIFIAHQFRGERQKHVYSRTYLMTFLHSHTFKIFIAASQHWRKFNFISSLSGKKEIQKSDYLSTKRHMNWNGWNYYLGELSVRHVAFQCIFIRQKIKRNIRTFPFTKFFSLIGFFISDGKFSSENSLSQRENSATPTNFPDAFNENHCLYLWVRVSFIIFVLMSLKYEALLIIFVIMNYFSVSFKRKTFSFVYEAKCILILVKYELSFCFRRCHDNVHVLKLDLHFNSGVVCLRIFKAMKCVKLTYVFVARQQLSKEIHSRSTWPPSWCVSKSIVESTSGDLNFIGPFNNIFLKFTFVA